MGSLRPVAWCVCTNAVVCCGVHIYLILRAYVTFVDEDQAKHCPIPRL